MNQPQPQTPPAQTATPAAQPAWFEISQEQARSDFIAACPPQHRQHLQQLAAIQCWGCVHEVGAGRRDPTKVRASQVWLPLPPTLQRKINPPTPALPFCDEHYPIHLLHLYLSRHPMPEPDSPQYTGLWPDTSPTAENTLIFCF